MPLLLLWHPQGVASPDPEASPRAVYPFDRSLSQLWLVHPDREQKWLINDVENLRVSLRKLPTGEATVRLRSTCAMFQQSEFPDGYPITLWSFDYYYRDMDAPLFSGPILNCTRNHDGYGNVHYEFFCESFFRHFFRRRCTFGPAATPNQVIQFNPPGDRLAAQVMNDCQGIGGTDGLWTTAFTYTGGDRADYSGTLLVSGWTVNMPTPANPGSAANYLVRWQARSNTLLLLMDIAEKSSLWYSCEESSPRTWDIGVSTPYQQNDLTDSVVLSDLRGTTRGASWAEMRGEITTAYFLTGQGKDGSQQLSTSKMEVDATGASTYGIYEDSGTRASITSASDLTTIATAQILAERALGVDTYTANLVESAGQGVLFNDTLRVGDKVTLEDSKIGLAATELLVVGAEVRYSHNGTGSISLVFNQRQRDFTATILNDIGLRGGFGAGGFAKVRDG